MSMRRVKNKEGDRLHLGPFSQFGDKTSDHIVSLNQDAWSTINNAIGEVIVLDVLENLLVFRTRLKPQCRDFELLRRF